MPKAKATPSGGQFSGARVVPLNIETAKQLGGGARGRTLALIYRQLCYWSKYAKWRGSRNRKFFYKAQRELAEELGYSEKTINRAIKALRELGLVVVEKLHKRYWRQTFFYYLPHSPFAAADAPPAPPEPAADAPAPDGGESCSTTTKPSSRDAVSALGAAAATAKSIRSRGSGGFGQNVRIQHKKNTPLIKQSLQAVVERCNAIGESMKNEQEGSMIRGASLATL
jgi:DNA-binding transcriptional regulator YhcF (GntR family)